MFRKRCWSDFFTNYNAVLCPAAPVVAIAHDHSPDIHAREISIAGKRRPYFDLSNWCAIASAADLPAAVTPVSKSTLGLPIGVQIISAQGDEGTAIDVAYLLETVQ